MYQRHCNKKSFDGISSAENPMFWLIYVALASLYSGAYRIPRETGLLIPSRIGAALVSKQLPVRD